MSHENKSCNKLNIKHVPSVCKDRFQGMLELVCNWSVGLLHQCVGMKLSLHVFGLWEQTTEKGPKQQTVTQPRVLLPVR